MPRIVARRAAGRGDRRAVAAALALLLPMAFAAPVAAQDAADMRIDTVMLMAPGVSPTPLRVRIVVPGACRAGTVPGCTALYMDDGQDMEAVGLVDTLATLAHDGGIRPPVVVAVDAPPDRMAAYGFSDRAAGHSVVAPTRHGDVGARAHAYTEWLVHTLVPFIESRYAVRPSPEARTVLGWSLGGAHAFNVGWQYPEVFARVGAFSPSFWLATDSSDASAVARTRIAHVAVDGTPPRNGARFFFAVGTDEETDDRDADGVNDAMDDVRELVDGTPGRKGLAQLGYSVNRSAADALDRRDVTLYELEGGRHAQASWARMLPAFLRWAYAVHAPPLKATGRVDSWHALPSRHVVARDVDVWLPPSYGRDPSRRYPVLYVHDGQNLFDPSLSYTGVDWDIDGAMTRLIRAHRVREAIVVGIANTPLRFLEYMPRAPVEGRVPAGIAGRDEPDATQLRSDAYVRFLAEELKPFIDAHYRTKAGPGDTAIMGSSMGGLISLYALAQRPDVFGGAAAVSTHWPAGEGATVDWFATRLPRAGMHRLYFDHGTRTLDAAYAPYQQRMDAAVRALGYRDGVDTITHVADGAEHNEAAWKARVDLPLVFLLGPR